MEILRTENLCKTYGSGENAVRAVDNVNLSVEKGEFVAIVGASGSGKSTLMHLIGGVDRPTGGKIFVDGQDIGAIKPEGEEIKVDMSDVEQTAEGDEEVDMSPAKRTTVKIISAILLILIACGLIWGTDAITGFIKGLFM